MNNRELHDSITATSEMVMAADPDSRAYDLLLTHLKALLAVQKQRAEHVPQLSILPQITPVLVYPPCSSSAEWVPPRPLGTC